MLCTFHRILVKIIGNRLKDVAIATNIFVISSYSFVLHDSSVKYYVGMYVAMKDNSGHQVIIVCVNAH